MELHEKSRDYDLMSCNNAACYVCTFVRTMECPVCHEPGSLVRNPVDGRGAPGWVGRIAEDE